MGAVASHTEDTSWGALYRLSEDQEGYFSTQQATQIGFYPQTTSEAPKSGPRSTSQTGDLPPHPLPPREHEELVVYWLWAEGKGTYSGETALNLHGLSDALPSKLHLTLPQIGRPAAFGSQKACCCTLPTSMTMNELGSERCQSQRLFAPSRTASINTCSLTSSSRPSRMQSTRASSHRRLLPNSSNTWVSIDDLAHLRDPAAFKTALEHRLKSASSTGADLNRRRQLLVFDRFLARMNQRMGEAVILKGGLVLELRLERARATKDIDLRMQGSSNEILETLQEAGQIRMDDFMTFLVQPDARLPEIPATASFTRAIDSGPSASSREDLRPRIWRRRRFWRSASGGTRSCHSRRQIGLRRHRASDPATLSPGLPYREKLHAYTMPRNRPNSRVKDLPDIALLASTGPLDGGQLRDALNKTFNARATHSLPATFPDPQATGQTVRRHGRARRPSLDIFGRRYSRRPDISQSRVKFEGQASLEPRVLDLGEHGTQ